MLFKRALEARQPRGASRGTSGISGTSCLCHAGGSSGGRCRKRHSYWTCIPPRVPKQLLHNRAFFTGIHAVNNIKLNCLRSLPKSIWSILFSLKFATCWFSHYCGCGAIVECSGAGHYLLCGWRRGGGNVDESTRKQACSTARRARYSFYFQLTTCRRHLHKWLRYHVYLKV